MLRRVVEVPNYISQDLRDILFLESVVMALVQVCQYGYLCGISFSFHCAPVHQGNLGAAEEINKRVKAIHHIIMVTPMLFIPRRGQRFFLS